MMRSPWVSKRNRLSQAQKCWLKTPLEEIDLGDGSVRRITYISAKLDPKLKSRLIELLKEYVDIFAWYYQDMPGLDTDIIEHHLPLKP